MQPRGERVRKAHLATESLEVKLRKLGVLSQTMRLHGSLKLQSDLIMLIKEDWSCLRI